MSGVIGIDLGGTKTAAGLVDGTGTVLARLEIPTPARDGARAVLRAALGLARELIAGREDVAAVGVGAAGVIDTERGVVLSATDALPGWGGTELGAELGRELAIPVSVVNDVHAHAVGEAWVGAGRNARTVLMITAGTGVGGALVLDGVVHTGAHGVSGHFGHLPSIAAAGLVCSCGRIGHVEAIASGPAIHAAFLRRGGDRSARDARAVAERARLDDALAVRCVQEAAVALGRTIGGLLNAVDPDLVVLAGGLASAGELWWSCLREGIAEEAMQIVAACPIRPSELGADAAIIGAAKVAGERWGLEQ